MEPKFALVQWIGGLYDQTYTAGIPVDWILNFDVDTFNPEEESEDYSYVIQWRDSKSGKKPKRGWKYYDAKVVRVSRHIESLEKQIQILDGVASSWRPVVAELKNLESVDETVEEETQIRTSTPTEKTETKKRKEKGDDEDGSRRKKKKKEKASEQASSNEKMEDGTVLQFLNESPDLEGVPVRTNRGSVYSLNNFVQADGEVPSISTAKSHEYSETLKKKHKAEAGHEDKGRNLQEKKKKSSDRESVELQIEIESLPDPPATPSNLEDQSLKRILLSLCQDIKQVKKVQLDMLENQNQPAQQQNPPAAQVEIGHPGTDVFVTQRQWDAADAQNSYTTMGVSLVRALFDDDVLMASNLRGGTSKIDKNAPHRPGLNSVIVAAIEEAVQKKFPDFKRGHFGAMINNMMNDLRRKNKASANAQAEENEEPED